MKKVENMQFKFRILVVMLVVVAVAIQIPYAFASSEFFEVSSTQIGQGETLTLTLNLSEVDYDEFEFKLTSNVTIDEMYTSEDVDVEETSSDYTIVIGIDKTQISSEQITLYYPISENTQIGTIIQFTAQIITDIETEVEVEDTNTTSTSGTENTTNTENNTTGTENTTNTETGTTTTTTTTTTVVTETIVDEITIEVEVVEATENDMMNMSGNMTGNMMDGMNMSMNMMDMDKMNMMGNMTMNMTMENMTDVTSGSTSSTNTVSYNGSDNNYLFSLEIDGVELNTTFNKENTTYFVTVENMDSLDITATADSSSAKVRITGEDDLQEGENKVLITVTAENGNVRYYRIYITNNITD